MPIFSLIYFILSWAFVVTFALFLAYSLVKKPEKNFNLKVSHLMIIWTLTKVVSFFYTMSPIYVNITMNI